MKSVIFRLAALVSSVVLAWLLLELVLGVLSTGSSAPPPRSLAINERHGSSVERRHRRTEPYFRRSARRFTILVAGDSFTWGAGIYHRDSYGKRLESLLERLDRQQNIRLELVSRPGWTTSQEFAATRSLAARLDPDLMILGYCLNDAETPQRYGLGDLEALIQRRQPANAASRLVYRKSSLYHLLWERLENSRQRRALDFYYHEIYERPGWQLALSAFDSFKALAERRGIPLVAVIFPIFDQQLDDGYSYRDLHALAASEFEKRGIPTLDLLPAYAGIDAVRLAVEPFTDPHPNELAHRIASQQLAHFLVTEGLVPIDRGQLQRIEFSLPATDSQRTVAQEEKQ